MSTTPAARSSYPAVLAGRGEGAGRPPRAPWPGLVACLLGAGVMCGGGVAAAKETAPQARRLAGVVEVRRTTDGIPHLRASNWRDLGFGIGHVQAEDALCTLAEAFVTYEGRRSWFFGEQERPARNGTFGRPRNLDLDFFFKAFADDAVLARYRANHPPELLALVEGFAAGYNHHLAQARAGAVPARGRPCLNEAWVREITPDDIHRRLYAAQIGAGYARFVTELANAQPKAAPPAQAKGASTGASTSVLEGLPGDTRTLAELFAHRLGDQAGVGSNVLAFGRQATGEKQAVLLGNPHWYWGGPDRFYQMHLTIPGRLNVAGVAFLGVPVIMIGFNEHVAWSHTVSEARRFGLFDVSLDAADPTRYSVDGQTEAMTSRQVSVDVRGPARPGDEGGVRRVTRTFYQTRFGPVIDLGQRDAAFGWGRAHAVAMRDVNAENFRVFRTFFQWNQARSLEAFIAIQRREASVPWVNTVAIGRGDGRVWYADMGAVPNVPDSLREACATPLSKGFARVDPLTPFLDASRAACDWRVDTAAAQPGAMPASQQPWLLREDYVANMNDSYWLTNARQPLEGFASVLGGERQALEMRGRLGHRIALEVLDKPAGSAAGLARRLMALALTPRVHSAELFKTELLAQACGSATVELDAATRQSLESASPAQSGGQATRVDVEQACAVLRQWPDKGDADDRGTLLWETFWRRLRAASPSGFYRVPFASDAPLDTPARPRADEGRAAQALAAAVLTMQARGMALDAPLGSRRFVETEGGRVPVYGGCHALGYFTVVCGPDGGAEALGPDAMANSYLQVVRFGPGGVDARTLLAHGQDETALIGGHGGEPVRRYARKDWLRFPFREADIARDPALRRTLLRTVAAPARKP